MTQASSVFSFLAFSEEDARTLALAVTCLAEDIANRDEDAERRGRKLRIVEKKLVVLSTIGLHARMGALRKVLTHRVAEWEEIKRTVLLVELAFASPFAPYEVEVSKGHRLAGLHEMAGVLGIPYKRVEEIDNSILSARKAHRHVAWGKIAVATVVGAVVLGLGGWAVAPLIGSALGGAAGLSGAAAVAHGLALLGGGSLAAGGAGMAGGMLAITGVGAAAGGLGMGGAVALWSAGYNAAVGELVKLQVSYREVLLRSQLRSMHVALVVERLNEQIVELQKKLNEERELNDAKSKRLEELERIIRAYEDAREWMSGAHS